MDATAFEEKIRALTRPINGQFPRPWMTDLRNPMSGDVFVVGYNQRKSYSATKLSHDKHVDALFNRNGVTCRGVYDELFGSPSPTRKISDRFVSMFHKEGVRGILETNVVCSSSDTIADSQSGDHADGAAQGKEIFRFLLRSIKPRCIVVHGKAARVEFFQAIGEDLSSASENAAEVHQINLDGRLIITIPSLSPQGFYNWKDREKQLPLVAQAVAKHVLHKSKTR